MQSISSSLTRQQCLDLYDEIIQESLDNKNPKALAAQKDLCMHDLFYLLLKGFRRRDINDPWLFDRCREVEAEPNGCLDLWAREHYKSTIITFALSIQDILRDPEETIGIFSHTKAIAKSFLDQIKGELEKNSYLKSLFSDILYANPERESPTWSLDRGILVKRKTNPKNKTVEAHGLVDGMPTGAHFKKLIYDDVVTDKSVNTPEQIKKTTECWELSLNLGTRGGITRYIGTRYHAMDTYAEMIRRGSVKVRKYAGTHNGKIDGDPIFLTRKELDKKRKDMGPYIFSAQILQDPTADNAMGFKAEWIHTYQMLKDVRHWNKYLLVDPASEKKQGSDYTVMAIIGLAPDENYYLLDGFRARLNLNERTDRFFELHRKWRPLGVGYEKYGKDSDIEHIEYVMELQNYRFEITPCGGPMAKNDRIRRLVPKFYNGKFWVPDKLIYIDHEDKAQCLVKDFRDEYDDFPVSVHDDIMDCFSRILDVNAVFPEKILDYAYGHGIVKDENKCVTDYNVYGD